MTGVDDVLKAAADLSLDGVKYAQVFHWDGAVHEGNGWRRLIVDEHASAEQRAAIEGLTSGAHGHPVYEIFSAMAPNTRIGAATPISSASSASRRRASALPRARR